VFRGDGLSSPPCAPKPAIPSLRVSWILLSSTPVPRSLHPKRHGSIIIMVIVTVDSRPEGLKPAGVMALSPHGRLSGCTPTRSARLVTLRPHLANPVCPAACPRQSKPNGFVFPRANVCTRRTGLSCFALSCSTLLSPPSASLHPRGPATCRSRPTPPLPPGAQPSWLPSWASATRSPPGGRSSCPERPAWCSTAGWSR
jgi:hypothetical protein